MSAPKQVVTLRDFTGGLNLRNDHFQIGLDESPDMLNVEVDVRGGARVRNGSRIYRRFTHIPKSFLYGRRSDGSTPLFIHYDTSIAQIDGDTFTWVADRAAFAQWGDLVYVTSASKAARLNVDGSQDALDQTYSDLLSPDDDELPFARVAGIYRQHLFIGDVQEDGDRKQSRVRWSHPNKPDSWQETDWVDLPSRLGPVIGLVPFRGNLLILQERGVHLLSGFDTNSFSVQQVTENVGCTSLDGHAVAPEGVYFWSRDGLVRWDGSNLVNVSAKIAMAINDDRIPMDQFENVHVSYVGGRVWVSLYTELDGRHRQRRVLIYDVALGKQGAWTIHDVLVGSLFESFADGAKTIYGFNSWDDDSTDDRLFPDERFIKEYDVEGLTYDEISPGVRLNIKWWWTSAWLDGGQPAQKKRWRRPYITMRFKSEGSMWQSVYLDWDSTTAKRVRELTPNTSQPDDVLIWDVGSWDVNVWGLGTGLEPDYRSVERAAPIGIAKAIQLRLASATDVWQTPDTEIFVAFDAISIPFSLKRLR